MVDATKLGIILPIKHVFVVLYLRLKLVQAK